ncbi:nucleotidyltransferase family protein [Parapedobacter sp. 10938]|uniref:nucleotidyltransferase family protein n=1 Tax=Parapedobacter flavus TaxID=3110225 RepID=UPI002DBEB498|nr:nucleotidyltransferase domain-containing protein [Parapedobacter sp. 10938]MEC3881129.1 nucleotidyltransferase domain-containing protein [Parapedobacter sp. 10938]
MQVIDFHSFEHFLRERNVFSRFGLERIGVFGSFARGESFNDIDLLLDTHIDLDRRIALRAFLEDELGVSIDIVVKDFAEPIILHRALKDVKYATAA